MKWATRKNMKSDRTASYWLIIRHIDRDAEFAFVEEQEIKPLTESGVLTFDAKDAKYKHTEDPQWGKYGDKCTFQTIMDAYGLTGKDAALDYMAKIIYAADIGHKRNEFIPHEGFGVWAAIQGLSYIEPHDSQKHNFIMTMFDSLYAYCKSVVSR